MKLYLNGQTGHVYTDCTKPELELRTTQTPDTVHLIISSENDEKIWDTGEISYPGSFYTCDLPSLKQKTCYLLSCTARCGETTDLAELEIETGFLGGEWKGCWIEPEQENAVREDIIAFSEIFGEFADEIESSKLRPGREISRAFTVNGTIKRARLYMTAHGVYTPYMNAVRIGNARLAPGITPYADLLYYQCYNLTPYLRQGENEFCALLGDGWWIGRLGFSGESCQYGDRLAALVQIEIEYEDGGREIIGSDDAFRSRRSFIDYSDLYIGERWDLTRAEHEWTPCKSAAYGTSNLKAQSIPHIVPLEEFEARLITTPKGELVADFGQVMAGVARLEVSCAAKQEVVLDHSETLDENGNFFKNIIGRNKQQRDTLLCPPGKTVFEPLHTYHGFRYVRITGLSRDEMISLKAVSLGTYIEYTGSFECSNEDLNQLQKNIRRSMLSNMVAIPTDCPQREKMGWTGDIQVFAKTGLFNAELLPFLSSWLEMMRLEQKSDGEIPVIVPNFPLNERMQSGMGGGNSSSAWGDACVLVPYYLYQCTGNIRVLKENLGMMDQWLCFIERATDNYLWRSGYHFGDWLIPSLRAQPDGVEKGRLATKEVISSSFYCITLNAWTGVLEALLTHGEERDLREKLEAAQRLLAKVRRAVREEYVSPDGSVKGDLQGLYVIILYAGVVEGELREKVAARLAQLIVDNGYRLDTGFVTVPYLLDVLSENGYKDLAYKLLFQTESPSWLYQIRMGATSIWENWLAVLPDGRITTSSMNHYALGCVGDWVYRNIGGITDIEPGYNRVLFAPDLDCGLDWCACSKQTAKGLVSLKWEKRGKKLIVELETPVPSTLTVGGNTMGLEPGKRGLVIDVS